MDRFDKTTRSRVMATVRSANTALEARLAKLLVEHDLSDFTQHARSLSGTPDFVFSSARLAIFLDSCFWHGCPKHLRRPTSNTGYWNEKIRRNRSRDVQVNKTLRSEGWTVLRIWEHALRDPRRVVTRVRARLAR